LGLTYLRYGLPYHKVHVGPGRYDWNFADLVMEEMQRLGIVPILDLLHFGVPDWLGDFQNPELPLHFAQYAEAVARRYPWVRHFTPVNEIFVSARLSAKDGLWNEQLRTDPGFVTALKHLVACNLLATQRIASVIPDAVLIPSESAEYVHEGRMVPTAHTAAFNRHRLLSLDLLYGRRCDSVSISYLLDSGMSLREYEWFMTTPRPGLHILGIDYYGRNEHIVSPTGQRVPVEDVFGLHAMSSEYHDRYNLPLMHTGTNALRAEDCPAWLWKQWMNVMRLRRDGVPMLGFTWYSLVDQIDWDIALAEKRGTVNRCGLFSLDRRPNAVAAEYQALVKEFATLPLYPVQVLSAAA
jgi:beta-glucosidase/6-phospho-beta-glucosidase/beta-galactosidase